MSERDERRLRRIAGDGWLMQGDKSFLLTVAARLERERKRTALRAERMSDIEAELRALRVSHEAAGAFFSALVRSHPNYLPQMRSFLEVAAQDPSLTEEERAQAAAALDRVAALHEEEK